MRSFQVSIIVQLTLVFFFHRSHIQRVVNDSDHISEPEISPHDAQTQSTVLCLHRAVSAPWAHFGHNYVIGSVHVIGSTNRLSSKKINLIRY